LLRRGEKYRKRSADFGDIAKEGPLIDNDVCSRAQGISRFDRAWAGVLASAGHSPEIHGRARIWEITRRGTDCRGNFPRNIETGRNPAPGCGPFRMRRRYGNRASRFLNGRSGFSAHREPSFAKGRRCGAGNGLTNSGAISREMSKERQE
jgi:hypothetical protein